MSIYQRFTNTDEGNELIIEHNLSAYDDEGRAVGLYIHGGSEFGTYSVDDIPRMIETLQAIYDDFEANKPKKPKDVAEALADYPNGTVVKFEGDTNARYIKVAGKWQSQYGMNINFVGWGIDEWPFIVKYNPTEDN